MGGIGRTIVENGIYTIGGGWKGKFFHGVIVYAPRNRRGIIICFTSEGNEMQGTSVRM